MRSDGKGKHYTVPCLTSVTERETLTSILFELINGEIDMVADMEFTYNVRPVFHRCGILAEFYVDIRAHVAGREVSSGSRDQASIRSRCIFHPSRNDSTTQTHASGSTSLAK